jgi:hypothetical protein
VGAGDWVSEGDVVVPGDAGVTGVVVPSIEHKPEMPLTQLPVSFPPPPPQALKIILANTRKALDLIVMIIPCKRSRTISFDKDNCWVRPAAIG